MMLDIYGAPGKGKMYNAIDFNNLMTVKEVAKEHNVSCTVVYLALNTGDLPFHNVMGKQAITKQDSQKWVPSEEKAK